jgi:hypothetical protein
MTHNWAHMSAGSRALLSGSAPPDDEETTSSSGDEQVEPTDEASQERDQVDASRSQQRRQFRRREQGLDPQPASTEERRARYQQRQRRQRLEEISEQSSLERAQTAVEAFDFVTERGEQARKEVRTVAGEADGIGGTALTFLGPPETRTGAALETAVSLIPLAGAPARAATRGSLRLGGRSILKAGAGEVAEETAETTISRAAGSRGLKEAGETTASKAGKEGLEEAGETAASRSGKEGLEEGGEQSLRETVDQSLRRADDAIDEFGTAKATGLALGGGAAAGAAGGLAADLIRDDGEDGQPETQSSDDDAASDGDDQVVDPRDRRDRRGQRTPGGPADGPFAATGAGPLSLGFLDRIGGGIGGLFNQLGQGLADTLTALGAPIGQGAGKAIAVGGTLLLIAIAVREGVGPFAQAGSSSSISSSSSSSSSTPPRGPDGQFVTAGGT